MTRPLRWGFLGAGGIARAALAPAVHAADGVVLQAAAARDPARAQALEPVGAAYDDYRALLADDAVDAVYVALANDAHLPWTVAALEAGKHVLCEKPLALTADEVRTMRAAADAADRLLVEAVWSRWHPRTRRAESLLAAGALGAVRHVEAAFTFDGVPAGNYREDPTMGGGAAYDVGVYTVSGARWATGGAPLVVLDAVQDTAFTGVDTTTRARLRSPGGADIDIEASIGLPERQALRVRAEGGDLDLPDEAFTSWHKPATLVVAGTVEHFDPVDAYRVMVESFARRVAGDDTAYVVPLEESLDVARTLDDVRAAAAGAP